MATNSAEYWRRYRVENRTTLLSQEKVRREKLRISTLQKYGGACTCCGESRLPFLSIDHINGGGRKHRQSLKGGRIEQYLKKLGYPKGYQVLCHNCNMAYGLYGKCPHKESQ